MRARQSTGARAPKITNLRHFLQPGWCDLPYDLYLPGNRVNRSAQNPCRTAAAWLCLLAVALLYAPLAAAAWASRSMACCTGNHCDIPAHHYRQAAAQPASHEDCGHGASELTPCSMSCCQTLDKPVVTGVAFVLPHLAFTTAPVMVTRAPDSAHSIEIPRSTQPLSPPPRIGAAAL
jgi:hypothetical protein